jgi:hypothetical protein
VSLPNVVVAQFEFPHRAHQYLDVPDTVARQLLDDRDRELENYLASLRNVATFTTGATAASGWSLVSFEAAVHASGIASFQVYVERTGGTITVPTSGDLASVNIATLPASLTPAIETVLTNGYLGRVAGGALQTGRNVRLGSVGGSDNIVNTDRLALGGTVILA